MPRQETDNATPINADFTNRPLYGGAVFQSSSAGMAGNFRPTPTRTASIQSNPVLEQVMRGAGVQNDAIAEFGQALAERNDFALSLTRKAEAAQLSAAMDQEFTQRAQLQDGSPGSFFTSDHALDANAIREFQNKYLRLTDRSTNGFLLGENKQRAAEAKATVQQGIRMSMNARILGLQKMRAVNAFSTDYYALLAAGDFNAAIDAIAQGQKMNIIGPQDATKLTNDARKAYSKRRAASSVAQGGKAAQSLDADFLDQSSE